VDNFVVFKSAKFLPLSEPAILCDVQLHLCAWLFHKDL